MTINTKPNLSYDDAIAFARSETAAVGFAETPPNIFADSTTADDWEQLAQTALRLKADPNMGLTNFHRGFGVYILYGEHIFPLPGIDLQYGDRKATVAGFDIGTANLENPGARVFAQLGDAFNTNRAFTSMLRAARDLDLIDPRARLGPVAVQAFIQAAYVNEDLPTIQAAPPDMPHNDECRFKANFLIAKRNVKGGATLFLPRHYAGQPLTDEAERNVLGQVVLSTPGHGYSFLDREAKLGENRSSNCHHAVGITLGKDRRFGYRIVGTFTPTPLLPSSGNQSEVDAAFAAYKANATALMALDEIVKGLSRETLNTVMRTLTS
ncbi:MAG: hypothetical protein AAF194_01180 [Pseudomonadota bacterium]